MMNKEKMKKWIPYVQRLSKYVNNYKKFPHLHNYIIRSSFAIVIVSYSLTPQQKNNYIFIFVEAYNSRACYADIRK